MGTRSSSIDRQPPEIQELISKLRFQGRTIDEILAQLKALDVEVARSSLGRHVKSLASASERMRHSRNMATALVERFGSEPDNKLARLNLELMHGAMLQLLTASDDDEQGQAAPVTFSPQDANFLSGALQKLASAEKTDADLRLKLRAEALKEAAGAVEKVAKEAGLTRETVATIRSAVLGVA